MEKKKNDYWAALNMDLVKLLEFWKFGVLFLNYLYISQRLLGLGSFFSTRLDHSSVYNGDSTASTTLVVTNNSPAIFGWESNSSLAEKDNFPSHSIREDPFLLGSCQV